MVYTCGRFIASVMPVRLFAPSLSSAYSFDLLFRLAFCPSPSLPPFLSLPLSTFLFLSCLTAIIVLLSAAAAAAADARSAVPRSAYTIRLRRGGGGEEEKKERKKIIVGDCVLLHCANSHDGAGDSP